MFEGLFHSRFFFFFLFFLFFSFFFFSFFFFFFLFFSFYFSFFFLFKAMMTYISFFRNAEPRPASDASRTRAFGPGLVEGGAGQDAHFKVVPPAGSNGKLEVKVVGPANHDCTPKMTKNADGSYDVVYNPTTPGDYEIHVTLDGEHVPGSIFHVTVLPEISLGGEGKILVFFSTTSSSNKGRRDVVDLQRLLEAKKVHERADFVPWVPVDIMTPEDRDLVFQKAGTKTLPIV